MSSCVACFVAWWRAFVPLPAHPRSQRECKTWQTCAAPCEGCSLTSRMHMSIHNRAPLLRSAVGEEHASFDLGFTIHIVLRTRAARRVASTMGRRSLLRGQPLFLSRFNHRRWWLPVTLPPYALVVRIIGFVCQRCISIDALRGSSRCTGRGSNWFGLFDW